MRKIVKWVLGIFALIVVILVAAPMIFKGQIVSETKRSLNENLKAKTDFKDVSLSLLRSFPNLEITLHDLSIDGIDEFEDIPLFRAQKASVAIGIWSLIGKDKPVKIINLSAESPLINILILANGKANYDIVVGDEAEVTDGEAGVEFEINHYALTDGNLRYEDLTMPMILQLDHFDHSGQGDFAQMLFDLQTTTSVRELSYLYNGITYLDRIYANLDAVIGIDLNNYKYTLKDNHLVLNDLELNCEGFIDLNDEDIELDLTFVAPKSDFRQLFSILPGAYTNTFAEAEILGSFDLQNRILGRYTDDSYPAFTLKTQIENGAVKYPDLPMGIRNINLDLDVDKPQGAMDLMQIALTSMLLEVGPHPLSGHLLIKTPISDPDVDGSLKGSLDLANLAKAYPMPAIQRLQGKVTSDVEFRARMSQVERKEYDKIQMSGMIAADDVHAQLKGRPLVQIHQSRVDFTPQLVKLSETRVQAGRSDVTLEGSLENFLAWISPQKTLRGSLTIRSGLLDLDEWSTEDTSSVAPPPASVDSENMEKKATAFDLDLNMQAGEVVINGERINRIVLAGRITPEKLSIGNVSASAKGSDMHMQGVLNNWSSYLAGQGILNGNLQLRSQILNLNPFMSVKSSDAPDTTGLTPFILPENLDLTIDAQVGQFVYTDMTFSNLKGQVQVANQTATLSDCSSEAFGGKFLLSGGYQTLMGEKPKFDLKYDMVGVQFNQIAQKFSYIKVLAPIIKFLDGRFSTSLITNGALNDNFMPDLSKLNLEGLVETTECLLKSFGPAEELAKRLKLNFLQSPRIKNTKNWLEIKNGVVEVKEFDYSVEDVNMQISGTQALNQELNFLIKMKIPRKYMETTELTKGLSEQLSWLSAEASKLGFKLSDGEFVNVNVMMRGTITQPTFDLKLVGMDGEKPLVDVVKEELKEGALEIADSIKTLAEAKRDSLLKEGEEMVGKVVDTLVMEAQKQVDSITSRAAQEIKNKVDEELSEKAKEVIDEKAGEVVGEKAKEEAGKLVDKLKGWKPFEKKKTTPPDSTKTSSEKEE